MSNWSLKTKGNTLASFVLLNTFVINATSVFVYWYYRAHRKNKSYVNRYNLLRGSWCEMDRDYYACRAFVKTVLTRLASASLSFGLLRSAHIPFVCALTAVQLIELWPKALIESRKFIYLLCSSLVKGTMLLSSLVACAVAISFREESTTARKLFWRGTILLWELFWFISKPKA
ncbi:MAG: hypothetical protein ACTS6G_00865 [Candidatus Hodgkinia cicadicola]